MIESPNGSVIVRLETKKHLEVCIELTFTGLMVS